MILHEMSGLIFTENKCLLQKFAWHFYGKLWLLVKSELASVTQLDVHLTGDQEVVGLTSAGTQTFFHGDLS